MANPILTQDKKRLTVFNDGIVINQKLPKWANASQRITEKKSSGFKYMMRETRQTSSGTVASIDTPFNVYSTPEGYEVKETVNFDEVAAANLRELTEMIKNNELNNVLSGYGGMHGFGSSMNYIDTNRTNIFGEKISLVSKIKSFIKKITEPKPEINVIDFFTQVKLASKDSAVAYCDRVSKYLKALHNANAAGQTALLETLLKEMIANKYESVLYAEGYYYAISEKQVIDFLKKTEKGIALTYLKNFTRPIPQEVIDKISEVNNLEIFDNYLVLHYDPNGESYKETEKEVAKRKDPILFGVIAGSNKLYYVTDWIDEYCDLTLEKFVDTLDIKKEDLIFDDEYRKEAKKEAKKQAKKEEKAAEADKEPKPKKEKKNGKKVSNKK